MGFEPTTVPPAARLGKVLAAAAKKEWGLKEAGWVAAVRGTRETWIEDRKQDTPR